MRENWAVSEPLFFYFGTLGRTVGFGALGGTDHGSPQARSKVFSGREVARWASLEGLTNLYPNHPSIS